MADLQARMEEDILQVNQALGRYFANPDPDCALVYQAMEYSLNAGGKRLRPVLTLEFCRALGGDPARAIPFACGVEMIHCYSLIHDDLPCMDDDDLRRGKPSCHIQFGEANALLAGDGLLTMAFSALSEFEGSAQAALKAVRILSHRAGAAGMIGGQVIDLAYEGKSVQEPVLKKLHTLKTSALIQAACEMGAAAAEADQEGHALAARYGLYLGLAFQIVDDILDVVGEEALLGKPVGSDEENQKTTYVTLLGLEGAKALATGYTAKAKACLEQLDHSEFLIELTNQLLDRKF